jgi:hypothetical protein
LRKCAKNYHFSFEHGRLRVRYFFQWNDIGDHAEVNRVMSRLLVEQGTSLLCQLKYVIKALSWRYTGITQIANLRVIAGGYAR